MRKLLLGTTAIAAAGAISTSAAVADVAISGAMEWTYESFDRGSAILGTGASNDDFSSDTNVKMTFTNKTDSGLEIGMILDLEPPGDDAASGVPADDP